MIDKINSIHPGGPSSTHLMLVIIGRDPTGCGTQGPEIVVARNHVVDVCSKPCSPAAEILEDMGSKIKRIVCKENEQDDQ